MTGNRNTEWYADPTSYAAMGGDRRFMPIVYICSPYAGNVERNIERTRSFCRIALESGRIPLAPHLLFPQFMNDSDPDERRLALFMDVVLLGKCRELWVLGDEVTDGMLTEIENAHKRGIPIRWFSEDYEEVTGV